MTVDASQRSRRAILGAALGAAGALAAGALSRAPAARAADGNPVILGQTNSQTSRTQLSDLTTADAELAGNKTGVWGATPSQNGYGVRGHAEGISGIGVQGETTGNSGIGVRGQTSGHNTQIAVDADTTDGLGEGYAVRARTVNGIALYGHAVGGYALQVDGRAVFSRSGRASFQQGQASKAISSQSLVSASIVLATIQGNVPGIYVRGVSLDVAGHTFTIRLNKAAPAALKVGWFIVN